MKMAFPGLPLSQEVLYPGLEPDCVLYLSMNEGRGERPVDISGCSNHGNLSGGRWILNGGIWSLEFDGTDDVINCGDASSLMPTQITIEVWIKPDPTQATVSDLVGRRTSTNVGGYALYYRPTHDMIFYIMDGGVWRNSGISSALEPNQWYHIAATYDGSTIAIFIDGDLNVSAAYAGGIDAVTTDTLIGQAATGAYYFKGLITEVRIYSRALTATEIARHWQMGI